MGKLQHTQNRNLLYKDIQELLEVGMDITSLKNRTSYITYYNKKYIYVSSTRNTVGVEVLIFEEL